MSLSAPGKLLPSSADHKIAFLAQSIRIYVAAAAVTATARAPAEEFLVMEQQEDGNE